MDTVTPDPHSRFPHSVARVVYRFLLVSALVAGSAGAEEQSVTLRLRTFPPDAAVLRNGEELEPTLRDGVWRVYQIEDRDTILVLTAPDHHDRPLHLHGVVGVITVEERLLPQTGPLRRLGEFPTGFSPKSVSFLPGNRIAVPLLRDAGVDLFRWDLGSGTIELEYLGTAQPRQESHRQSGAGRTGFVESVVLPSRGEFWVTQMDPDLIHRFELESGRWSGSLVSGGRWPKVLLPDGEEERVFVANWNSESVASIDVHTGEILRTVAVGGRPRGLWLSPDQRYLWVCLFSTGDIEVIDTRRYEVIHRFGLPPGAARHIVGSADGTTVYYSDMWHGTVSMIDTERRAILRRRRIGPNVNTIALDPAGRYLYVSVRGRNNPQNYRLPGPEHGRIVVLDANTLDPVQTIWGRRQPTGLAVSPDGTLLVTTDFLDDNLTFYQIIRCADRPNGEKRSQVRETVRPGQTR